MNDNYNEILRALECCGNGDFCNHCKYQDLKDCHRRLAKDALDLINRQQAEIERLQRLGASATRKMINAKSEARKEFAERVIEKIGFNCSLADVYEHIDNLLEEMENEKI